MACTDRGKAYLVHLAFYTLQAFLIGIAYAVIFSDSGPDDINIVGDNPGLSYRPHLPDSEFESIISYKVASIGTKDYERLVDSLTKFLEAYRKPGLLPGRGRNIANCNFDNPPRPGQVCDVDVKRFSRCIKENNYDYHRGSPCVFLRLNTPPGWKPVFYNDTKSLPDEMPSDLKEHITSLARSNPEELNTVWVSCEGATSADKEFIGSLEYFPSRGFPGYYTLNTDIEGYLSPLVAIHFEKPEYGLLINIKCKAWARNIKHDKDSALGGVNFGLMIN